MLPSFRKFTGWGSFAGSGQAIGKLGSRGPQKSGEGRGSTGGPSGGTHFSASRPELIKSSACPLAPPHLRRRPSCPKEVWSSWRMRVRLHGRRSISITAHTATKRTSDRTTWPGIWTHVSNRPRALAEHEQGHTYMNPAEAILML